MNTDWALGEKASTVQTDRYVHSVRRFQSKLGGSQYSPIAVRALVECRLRGWTVCRCSRDSRPTFEDESRLTCVMVVLETSPVLARMPARTSGPLGRGTID